MRRLQAVASLRKTPMMLSTQLPRIRSVPQYDAALDMFRFQVYSSGCRQLRIAETCSLLLSQSCKAHTPQGCQYQAFTACLRRSSAALSTLVPLGLRLAELAFPIRRFSPLSCECTPFLQSQVSASNGLHSMSIAGNVHLLGGKALEGR